MPRVSVLIPTCNRLPELERALRSCAVQTYSDFEVIVVNDGGESPDEIVAKMFPDMQIRVFHQANGGPAAARNTCLQAANGEFVAYLDDDDEWGHDHLNVHVGVLDSTNRPTITYGIANVVDRGTHQRYWGNCEFDKFLLDGFFTLFPLSACMHRRDIVDATGIFDENPLLIGPEDCEFLIRLSDLFIPVPSKVATVTMHRERSMTRNPRAEWVGVLEYVINKLGYGRIRQNWLMFFRAYVAAVNECRSELVSEWEQELDRLLPPDCWREGEVIRGRYSIDPGGIKAFCRAQLKVLDE